MLSLSSGSINLKKVTDDVDQCTVVHLSDIVILGLGLTYSRLDTKKKKDDVNIVFKHLLES